MLNKNYCRSKTKEIKYNIFHISHKKNVPKRKFYTYEM